jgi:hypothetical protein
MIYIRWRSYIKISYWALRREKVSSLINTSRTCIACMGIKDRLVSWYVENILIPGQEDIDSRDILSRGYVTRSTTDRFFFRKI